jgi:hypothetical protein
MFKVGIHNYMSTYSRKLPTKPLGIPFLVQNPMLSIYENNEKGSIQPEEFFLTLQEASCNKSLNPSFKEGLNYINKKYEKSKNLEEIIYNYFDQTFECIHSITHINEDDPDDLQFLETLNLPFFIVVNYNRYEAQNIWTHLENILKSNFEKHGFEFKMLPKIHTIKELETLMCDGVYELKEKILKDKKTISIYTEVPPPVSHKGYNEHSQGVVFGTLRLNKNYFDKNKNNVHGLLGPVMELFYERISEINNKNIYFTGNTSYIQVLKDMFLAICRSRTTKLITEEINSHEFEGVDIEINQNVCKIKLLSNDENYTFSFYWPEDFSPIADGFLVEYVQEILSMEEKLEQHKNAVKEAKQKKLTRIMMSDDSEMNDVVDKVSVDTELSQILSKYKK